MADPKKHHFLPQFYLERFAALEVQAKLPRIHVSTKEQQPKQYTAAIHDTACIVDYHTVDFRDLPRDRAEIERKLSKLEGQHNQLTDKVISCGAVADDIKEDMALFIALTHMRVPKFKRNIESFLRSSLFSMGDAMMRHGKLPPLPDALKEYEGKSLREFLTVDIDNWIILSYMYDAALSSSFSRILQRMHFHVLRAPSSHPFITCDSPVCIYHPHYDKIRPYGVSPLFPEAEVSIPLTPEYLVLLINEDRKLESQLGKEQVEEFNRRVVVMADRYIYSSTLPDSLAAFIVRYHRLIAGFVLDELDSEDGSYLINRFIPVHP